MKIALFSKYGNASSRKNEYLKTSYIYTIDRGFQELSSSKLCFNNKVFARAKRINYLKMCGTNGQFTQSQYVTYNNVEFYYSKLREIEVCREFDGASFEKKINLLSRSWTRDTFKTNMSQNFWYTRYK
jgi:hypothetical protein